jgi:hypothetical protein
MIFNTIPVDVEGVPYSVLANPNMSTKQASAELLRYVDESIIHLRNHIKAKYTDDYLSSLTPTPKAAVLAQIRRRVMAYSSSSLVEHYPSKPTVDVSYNLDKGSKIAMCVRKWSGAVDNSSSVEYQKKNDILFVALHELAHSLNCDESAYQCGDSYGHDNMFWYIFKQLLDEASEAGIYQATNYAKSPVNYCSLDITYSPQFDPMLHDDMFF